jgi:predicted anti-sigma-YlaC factor YlaD
MNGGHWTEQDFIDHLYGVDARDGHLDVCAACRARWTEIQARRESIIEEPEVPHEILAKQRRNIYRRLGRESHPAAKGMMPAFAVVLLLLVGFFFMRPGPTSTVPSQVTDAELFSDIYAVEQSSEPGIAKPMRALFEENR